ncbi:aminoglycoside phosphotransferase family protein [Streptomyces sp. NPDC048182]|uniref:aminoglycoside phosphotransferase family protein n=1 Tax=Streptomyces sp. NPDC048182 TaxID=3365507 RepID=UPI00371B6E13
MGTVETAPEIDVALIRRLVDDRFPQWAGPALEEVRSGGLDHVIYRLGEGLAVRLPRRVGVAGHVRVEAEWLPRLAPALPLAVPVVVGVGEPGFGYPWPWAVSRWLDGEVATVELLGDSVEAAGELARFLGALHGFPVDHADEGLAAWALADRDRVTREGIAEVAGVFDAAAMTRVWDAALDAPAWDRPPVLFHGDFHTGNLLMDGGRLSAVIDFGGLGAGDPACDLMIAFTLLGAEARAVFRETLAVDDATWARGRGWALATGLNAYTYYAAVDDRIAAQTRRQIHAALADAP